MPHRRRAIRAAATLAAVSLVLLGCGGNGVDEDPAEDGDPAAEDDTGPPDHQDGEDAEDGEGDEQPGEGDDGDGPSPIADGADLEPKESPGDSPGLDAAGNLRPQAVTAVRVASHEGFDRVVFELESEGGTPGWFVAYEDPVAQGSGYPVEVAGGASLTVSIYPVSLPPDLPPDVTTWAGDPIDGPADGLVRQVVGGTVYEGHHQFFVGTDRQRPFVVARLDDPARIVLDILREAP